jgi:16S rRNA (uracil1498-N3)-methyltransferase
MRVFLLPASFAGDRECELTGKDYRYLIRVLRFSEGSCFPGRDAQGRLWDLMIEQIDHRNRICRVSVREQQLSRTTGSNPLPSVEQLPEIHLFQCVLKGKKLDTLIRQSVEIGIHTFTPVQSAFSVPDFLTKDPMNKITRWEVIRDEALQQCGSSVMTAIARPISLGELIRDWDRSQLGIFFHQEPLNSLSLQQCIVQHQSSVGRGEFPVSLLIGPEGGFSDAEVADLKKAGFTPAFLRTNILRAETAAVYAAACTQMILSEISSQFPKKSSALSE